MALCSGSTAMAVLCVAGSLACSLRSNQCCVELLGHNIRRGKQGFSGEESLAIAIAIAEFELECFMAATTTKLARSNMHPRMT